VAKSGQFHDPQFGIALKKVGLQSGVLTPGEVGIRTEEKRPDFKKYPKEEGEKNGLEWRAEMVKQPEGSQQKGTNPRGRPKNAKDKVPRKKRSFTPKMKATLEIWAKSAQSIISDIIDDKILAQLDKKTKRSLTSQEAENAELVKLGILFHLNPLTEVNVRTVSETLNLGDIPEDIHIMYVDWISEIQKSLGRPLTLDETKQIQASLYATYHTTGEE
jgi:hypothetical protein